MRLDGLQRRAQRALLHPQVIIDLQAQEDSPAQAERTREVQVGVGGDGPLGPSTISSMRRGGTAVARASTFCESPLPHPVTPAQTGARCLLRCT